MAVGGLTVRLESVGQIECDLAAIKQQFGVSSEIKWTNCKRYYGKAHKAYIDYLFEKIAADELHFHIRFSPMAEYDHSKSGERKETDTVSKAFFQLIVHRPMKLYGNTNDIMLRFDAGECTRLLPGLVESLNFNAVRRYNYCQRECIIHAEPRDSAREPLLQLLDVTLGALASYRNERHKGKGAHPTKTYLAEYAFKKTGVTNIKANTPFARHGMSIWNVVPHR